MSDAPADQITDFEDLYVRRLGGHTFRVLSLAGDEQTAYQTNIKDLSCTCPDYDFNQEAPAICKHLQKSIFQAPADPSLEKEVFDNLVTMWDMASEAVKDIQDVRDVAQAAQNANAAAAISEGQDQADQDTGPELEEDPVDAVDRWLTNGFGADEHVEVSEGDHDGTAGVRLEPDNQAMPDGQYEAFKSLINSMDNTTVHVGFGDDPCNTCGQTDGEFWYHVPAGTIAEVMI